MPRETLYLMQAFAAPRGKASRPEPPVSCKSAEEARRRAERLSPLRLGVVAFAISGDAELGDYDDRPTLLFKAGQVPPPFDDL